MPLLSDIRSSGSLTTTVANTTLVAGIVVKDHAANFISFANSFTETVETTSGTPDMVCADRTVSSTGTYNTNVQQSPGILSWSSAGIILALRDADQLSDSNSSMFLIMI